MSSQVCVICYNKNTVNQTDNRLVTESCGHVKCMNCLLLEKSGCLACLRNGCETETNHQQLEQEPNQTFEIIMSVDDAPRENNIQLENLTTKKKYDYSHIKTEIGMPYNVSQISKHMNTTFFYYNINVYLNFIFLEGSKKRYYCTICKKKFYSRSQICYHAYCNGEKKPYNCQLCKQVSSNLFLFYIASK